MQPRCAGLVPGISIHALREEGDAHNSQISGGDGYISIHALREEGDLHQAGGAARPPGISIHALREEGDLVIFKPGKENC